MTTDDKRQAATAQFTRANDAINTVFDRADELRETLRGVSAAAASADLVRAARDVLDRLGPLSEGLAGLRAAAEGASNYRTKADLASDIDTKIPLLFPRERHARSVQGPRLAPPAASAAESPPADDEA